MPLVERNHEIQAFAADGSHQSFAKYIRLRCANGRSEHRQTHRRQAPIDALRINAVAIVDRVAMRAVPRHNHSELLPGPVSRGMRRHVPVHDPSRAHLQDHECTDDVEGGRTATKKSHASTDRVGLDKSVRAPLGSMPRSSREARLYGT